MNECLLLTHNCDVNGLCTNTNGSFSCACQRGYTGDGYAGTCNGKLDDRSLKFMQKIPSNSFRANKRSKGEGKEKEKEGKGRGRER